MSLATLRRGSSAFAVGRLRGVKKNGHDPAVDARFGWVLGVLFFFGADDLVPRGCPRCLAVGMLFARYAGRRWPGAARANGAHGAADGHDPFLSNISERADGERRETRVDPTAPPKVRLTRDLSDAALRFDLALSARRRHAPKSC